MDTNGATLSIIRSFENSGSLFVNGSGTIIGTPPSGKTQIIKMNYYNVDALTEINGPTIICNDNVSFVDIWRGTLNISNANITSTNMPAIYRSVGTNNVSINIKSGATISSSNTFAIRLSSSSIILNIASGIITSGEGSAIYQDSDANADIIISGGTISNYSSSTYAAVNLNGTGSLAISGGTIYSETGYAIYINYETVLPITGNPKIYSLVNKSTIYAQSSTININTDVQTTASTRATIASNGGYIVYAKTLNLGYSGISSNWQNYAPTLYTSGTRPFYWTTTYSASPKYFYAGKVYSKTTNVNYLNGYGTATTYGFSNYSKLSRTASSGTFTVAAPSLSVAYTNYVYRRTN